MSEDFRGFLQQMQGCAVSVVTWDHARLLGTLAAVADDCIRMTGVVLQDSHETGGWSDRLLIEDLLEDRGNQWPEIIIQRNLISTVTMVSDVMRPDQVVPLGREDSSDGLENSRAAQGQELDKVRAQDGARTCAFSERTVHPQCTMTCHNTHVRTQRRDMFVDDVPLHRESCNYTSTTLLSAAGRLIRPFRRSRLNPSVLCASVLA